MDTAVQLVATYLQLNGYFVQTEIPVVERQQDDPASFAAVTDIDLLAIRFPSAVHRQPPRDSSTWAGVVRVDPDLGAPEEEMDVLIGEVKEGRSRINPNLTSRDVLSAALSHTGGCLPEDIERLVDQLLDHGEATSGHCHGGCQRIRIVVFGGTLPDDEPGRYRVITLRHVVEFLNGLIDDNESVFKVIDAKDPTLGTLLLQHKLGL